MRATLFAFYGSKEEGAEEKLLSFVSSWKERLKDDLVLPMPLKDTETTKETLLEKGVAEVRVITLLLEEGRSYTKLLEKLDGWKRVFRKVTVTPPILDSEDAIQRLLETFGEESLLVFHGTKGRASKAAETINRMKGKCHACVLEGCPEIKDVLGILDDNPLIVPFFFTEGFHLKEDLLSDEDSLFAFLRKAGKSPRLSSWTLPASSFLMDEVKRNL